MAGPPSTGQGQAGVGPAGRCACLTQDQTFFYCKVSSAPPWLLYLQAKAKLESDLQAGVYDKMDEWVANLKDLAVSC